MRTRHVSPKLASASRGALLVALGTLLVACGGVGFDENTGGDGTRGGAVDVQVNVTYHDRLSPVQGDHTDWKKFALEHDAQVSVHIWWDEPAIRATVALRDELGQPIQSLTHQPGQRAEILGPRKLTAGTYYLEFQATTLASVYTFEIRTADPGGVPRPDF